MNHIFISYRREDAADVTGRIHDRLRQHFGEEAIFTDVDKIPLGVDFRAHLDEKVGLCEVLLPVIGKSWLSVKNEEGQLRLQAPTDFVRIEIESALRRKIPVIPLLVQGVEMPSADQLPESLRTLAFRNGMPVRPDPDFHKDMDRLINGLEEHLRSLEKNKRRAAKDEAPQQPEPKKGVHLQPPERREAGAKRKASATAEPLQHRQRARKTTNNVWFAIVGVSLLMSVGLYYFWNQQQKRIDTAQPLDVAEAKRSADSATTVQQKPEAQAEEEPVADVGTEAKREPDTETQARQKTDTEAQAKRIADAEAKTRREADRETQASQKTDTKAEPRHGADAETVAQQKPEAEAETKRITDSEAKTKPEADTEIQAQAKPDAEAKRTADAEAAAKSIADAAALAQRKAAAEAQAKRIADTEAAAQPPKTDADGRARTTHLANAQAAAQRDRKSGNQFRDILGDGSPGPVMVIIPTGSFRMGDLVGRRSSALRLSRRQSYEKPIHTVTLKSFAIGKYEVTFEEYDRFARATNRDLPQDEGWGRADRPVVRVSWEDAVAYAQWLSQDAGMPYRLPSEAEWEYAARAGAETNYWWGNEISRNRANCDGCDSEWDNRRTAPVGSFAANRFGAADTSGNVWEWVHDCWNDSYKGAPVDGTAWLSSGCAQRVIRGGSWTSEPQNLRSSDRYRHTPNTQGNDLGFRVVQDL